MTATTGEQRSANLVLRARNQVVNELIEAHKEEYHDRMEKACAVVGAPYERPMTPEDRARRDIKALFEKYPEVADEFLGPEEPDQG